MSKSDSFEQSILNYIFNNVDPALGANLSISLHTADPGEPGDLPTTEANYIGYQRQAVPRSSSSWNLTDHIDNVLPITFPVKTAGPDITVTHFAISKQGDNIALYSGALVSPLEITTGTVPQFRAGDLRVFED